MTSDSTKEYIKSAIQKIIQETEESNKKVSMEVAAISKRLEHIHEPRCICFTCRDMKEKCALKDKANRMRTNTDT